MKGMMEMQLFRKDFDKGRIVGVFIALSFFALLLILSSCSKKSSETNGRIKDNDHVAREEKNDDVYVLPQRYIVDCKNLNSNGPSYYSSQCEDNYNPTLIIYNKPIEEVNSYGEKFKRENSLFLNFDGAWTSGTYGKNHSDNIISVYSSDKILNVSNDSIIILCKFSNYNKVKLFSLTTERKSDYEYYVSTQEEFELQFNDKVEFSNFNSLWQCDTIKWNQLKRGLYSLTYTEGECTPNKSCYDRMGLFYVRSGKNDYVNKLSEIIQ